MAILDLMGHCFFFSRTHTYIFSISPAWPGPAGAEKKKKKKTESPGRERKNFIHTRYTIFDFHVFNQVGDGNRNFVVLKQYKSQARPQIIGGPKKNIEIFIFNL